MNRPLKAALCAGAAITALCASANAAAYQRAPTHLGGFGTQRYITAQAAPGQGYTRYETYTGLGGITTTRDISVQK